MPTYAYRCPKGHEFDRVQKISEPAGADCPECGQAAERLITGGVGLVFKGSGFYITDYKRAGKKKPKAKDAKAKESGASAEKSTGTAKGSDTSAEKRGPEKPSTGSSES